MSTTSTTTPSIWRIKTTDSGVLTVLMQGEQDGLEVYSGSKEDRNDGHWVPVPPVPGGLTINTGDMLQVWSNDLYQAAEHRVRASRDRVRYSAPFFYNPSYDTLVTPLTCYVTCYDELSIQDDNVSNEESDKTAIK
eukprot:CAMPEP_0170131006 /NCGR_PEP_ID=MMETSP0020_2-20130122/22960_1 /TAXON_ID=98059 /ORGANISM="Dinobryon sp., Strain UTEXLB2267" /LENGTH=135 /DNA_ID=CAMNT_0010365937 /DNA_START=436 /DNA_END=841 /DNA_ORIENTATION=+